MNDRGIPSTNPGNEYPIPKTMKAWVLGGPEELALVEKPVPEPGLAEVLVRIDAVAVCATDLEIIKHGCRRSIEGELPFNKGYHAGPRVHGHGGEARPDRRRIPDSATASPSKFMPDAAAASAAAKACTPRA